MPEALGPKLHRFAASHLEGRVVRDPARLNRLSRDMGMYRIPPRAAVAIRSAADLQAMVRFAREERVPLIARGGGSNTGGTAIGDGILLLFSEADGLQGISPLNDADTDAYEDAYGDAYVRVGAAVRHDHLQRALAERGRMLPSDPSSGPLSLIGGNVATKASGAHAFKYGAIDRYIVALEAVMSDGSVLTPRSMPKWSRAVLQELREKLLGSTEALAAVRRHEGLKSASGYNLAALLEHEAGAQSPFLESQTLARLFTGSLGTLGLVSEVTLRTEPLERGRAGVLLFFRDLPTATEAASSVRTLDVAAIEILNREAIALARSAEPDIAVPEDSGALLLVETTGEARLTVSEEVRRRTAHLAKAAHLAEGEEELTRLWSVRKRLLLLLRSYSPNHRALAVVNDVGVPPRALRRFTEHAEAVFRRHGLRAPIYGHAGDGNLHLRPLFDLRDPRLRHTLESVAREIYEAVVEHGGTITAEHGIGRQRAPFLEAEWGSEAYELMRRLKRSFDPEYLLNPEAMFPSHELGEHLDL